MPGDLVAVVEIPKGSSNKYEWDEELGAIKLDRLLFSSLGYPTDYGFFRETLAADGDPLDAMIAVSEPTFPGCLIEVKPVALFRMRDQKAQDDKILCVPHISIGGHLGGLIGGAAAAFAMDRLAGRRRGVALPVAACVAIGLVAAVAAVAVAGRATGLGG